MPKINTIKGIHDKSVSAPLRSLREKVTIKDIQVKASSKTSSARKKHVKDIHVKASSETSSEQVLRLCVSVRKNTIKDIHVKASLRLCAKKTR